MNLELACFVCWSALQASTRKAGTSVKTHDKSTGNRVGYGKTQNIFYGHMSEGNYSRGLPAVILFVVNFSFDFSSIDDCAEEGESLPALTCVVL